MNDFTEYSQDREFIKNLIEDYKGISNEDLSLIREEINSNKDIVSKIKEYRDQYLAHDDINKEEIIITGEEALKLFTLMEKILNIFSSKLISTTSIYDHVERDAKDQVRMMFDFLKRFEPYRIKEIEEEAREELQQHNIVD